MQYETSHHTNRTLALQQLDYNFAPQTKTKLIYRGNIFYRTSQPATLAKTIGVDWPTIRLIYRGHTYQRQLPPQQPYQKPVAINWRWQLAS